MWLGIDYRNNSAKWESNVTWNAMRSDCFSRARYHRSLIARALGNSFNFHQFCVLISSFFSFKSINYLQRHERVRTGFLKLLFGEFNHEARSGYAVSFLSWSICSCGVNLRRVIWANQVFRNLHTNQIVSDMKTSEMINDRLQSAEVREGTPTTAIRCQNLRIPIDRAQFEAILIWEINSERILPPKLTTAGRDEGKEMQNNQKRSNE